MYVLEPMHQRVSSGRDGGVRGDHKEEGPLEATQGTGVWQKGDQGHVSQGREAEEISPTLSGPTNPIRQTRLMGFLFDCE